MGHVIHVGVTDRLEEAAKVVAGVPGVKKVTLAGDDPSSPRSGRLMHVAYEEGPGQSQTDIPSVLLNNGYRITKFAEEPVNLETAFMRLTKGLVRDHAVKRVRGAPPGSGSGAWPRPQPSCT